MIAQKLDAKLRDFLTNSKASYADKMGATGRCASALEITSYASLPACTDTALFYPSFQRPVLILLDRDLDIPTVLHHTWTYQALVHDILGLAVSVNFSLSPTPRLHLWYSSHALPSPYPQLNRTKVVEKLDGGRSKERTFDLERTDAFWHKNKGLPFPTVATAVEEELSEYKRKEQEIKSLHVRRKFRRCVLSFVSCICSLSPETRSVAGDAVGGRGRRGGHVAEHCQAHVCCQVRGRSICHSLAQARHRGYLIPPPIFSPSSMPELLQTKRLLDMHMVPCMRK